MPERRPYECMVIVDADLDEETIRDAVERWVQLLEAAGAERGYVDHWGKRRLAYEIDHRTEGYYVVFQAKADPAAMAELQRVLSLADEVVRHKVLRVPEEVYGPPAHLGAAGGSDGSQAGDGSPPTGGTGTGAGVERPAEGAGESPAESPAETTEAAAE